MSNDPRIDAYIDRQAEFARPILSSLREMVHEACPEAEETLKWSAPAFLYKGKILAMMAAFKAHATFSLWRGEQLMGDSGKSCEAMGQFGRLTSIDDLPDGDALQALIRKAMELIDAGVKAPRKKNAPKPPPEAPDDLKTAIEANSAAAATYAGFSPSARRDYVEWVMDAKQPATRERRIAQAVEWMAEGKKRHWKYEKC